MQCPGVDRLNYDSSSVLACVVTVALILLCWFTGFIAWVNVQFCSRLCIIAILNMHTPIRKRLWIMVTDTPYAIHVNTHTHTCSVGNSSVVNNVASQSCSRFTSTCVVMSFVVRVLGGVCVCMRLCLSVCVHVCVLNIFSFIWKECSEFSDLRLLS